MELKEHIENINFLIHNSDEYRYCIQYIYDKKVKKDESLDFILISSWSLMTIELCKIIEDSQAQHFNVHKLLKRLESSYRKDKRKKLFEYIHDFSNFLEEQKDTFKSIHILRSKFYAHTDKNKSDFLSKIKHNLNDIKKLIEQLKLHMNYIYGELFDIHFAYQYSFDGPQNLIDFYIKGVEQFKKETLDDFQTRYETKDANKNQ